MNKTNVVVTVVLLAVIALGGAYLTGYFGAPEEPAAEEGGASN